MQNHYYNFTYSKNKRDNNTPHHLEIIRSLIHFFTKPGLSKKIRLPSQIAKRCRFEFKISAAVDQTQQEVITLSFMLIRFS
jgi:hypothetical protein